MTDEAVSRRRENAAFFLRILAFGLIFTLISCAVLYVLTDETGEGLLAAADSAPMEASALHYTPEALTQAKHPYQLTATENVILRLNAVQIGLGGDNSWYRIIVHEPYLTPLTRDYDYAYILSPLSAKEDAMEKARTIRNYP